MADAKISDLTAVSAVAAVQLLPVVDDPSGTPTTKKATVTQLSTFLAAESKALTNKTISGASNTISSIAQSSVTSLTADIAAAKTEQIGLVIDGGGSAITTGFKGCVQVPFACTINSWTILATDASVTSGSIVIDVWRDSYANFPPVDADSITASAPPTMTTATKATSSTLTGWTTSITAGDVLGFNVDSVTSLLRVTLLIKVTKT